jgi:hypothetical protein
MIHTEKTRKPIKKWVFIQSNLPAKRTDSCSLSLCIFALHYNKLCVSKPFFHFPLFMYAMLYIVMKSKGYWKKRNINFTNLKFVANRRAAMRETFIQSSHFLAFAGTLSKRKAFLNWPKLV